MSRRHSVEWHDTRHGVVRFESKSQQSESPNIERLRGMLDEGDDEQPDEILFTAGGNTDGMTLVVAADTACGICRSIKQEHYGPWKKDSLVFTFVLYEPVEYSGQKLKMFVRNNKEWYKPGRELPPSSKLYKQACFALGRRLRKGETAPKSLFLRRAFRLKLSQVGYGAAAYTEVETILEKLTG